MTEKTNYMVVANKPYSSNHWGMGNYEEYSEENFIKVVSSKEEVADIIVNTIEEQGALFKNEKGWRFMVFVEGEPFGRFLPFPKIDSVDSEDIEFDKNCKGEDNASFERQNKLYAEIKVMVDERLEIAKKKEEERQRKELEKKEQKEEEKERKKIASEKAKLKELKEKYPEVE